MRLHQSESAFFVFIAVVLAAGVATYFAYETLTTSPSGSPLRRRSRRSAGWRSCCSAPACCSLRRCSSALSSSIRRSAPRCARRASFRAMTVSLSARSETLEQAALTDSLTGMQNRRYFDDALREYLEEFQRIGKPVGLMILDLDHFKDVNDSHGHDVGDEVLRAVASCLKDMTRYHDVVARLGGEEFAVVAPNMDNDLLMKLAERIRKAIAAMAIMSGNVRLKITTSVGLAVWNGKRERRPVLPARRRHALPGEAARPEPGLRLNADGSIGCSAGRIPGLGRSIFRFRPNTDGLSP